MEGQSTDMIKSPLRITRFYLSHQLETIVLLTHSYILNLRSIAVSEAKTVSRWMIQGRRIIFLGWKAPWTIGRFQNTIRCHLVRTLTNRERLGVHIITVFVPVGSFDSALISRMLLTFTSKQIFEEPQRHPRVVPAALLELKAAKTAHLQRKAPSNLCIETFPARWRRWWRTRITLGAVCRPEAWRGWGPWLYNTLGQRHWTRISNPITLLLTRHLEDWDTMDHHKVTKTLQRNGSSGCENSTDCHRCNSF